MDNTARAISILRRFGTLLGLLGVIAYFSWRRPDTFLSVPNWLNITEQVSILGVVAFAMTIVMVVGDFDLSVGSMASLAGIVCATMFTEGYGIFAAVCAALLVGMLGGLFNGVVVSYVGVLPFVATLGTLTLFSGLSRYISDGTTIFGRVIPEAFGDFGRGGIELGTVGRFDVQLSNLTIIAILVLIVVWIILAQTVYGRRLYAIGGNREAARLGGVRTRLLRMTTFVVSGLGAAIAGVMLTSRLSSANPNQGDDLMLDAIASVFLGMTMSEEGEPNVQGTLVGVLILGVMVNGLTQMRVDSYIQDIVTGTIIILAVTASSLSRRSSG